VLAPFSVLFDDADLPAYALPEELERLCGRLGLADRVVYANFVSSIDGVAALGSGISAGSVISGKFPADRFLMGLLRACADAVVIGAGTLRATPGHVWTPAHVFPDLAAEFAKLRVALGRSPEPRLVVLTESGRMHREHPALKRGAIIVTSEAAAKRIARRLPPACEVIGLGRGKSLNLERVFRELRNMGFDAILTEGGPHLMGGLIKAGLLDEIFLTLSPIIAGRKKEPRLGMVEGVELLPKKPAWSRLLSARRHGDYLFLRYSLTARGEGVKNRIRVSGAGA
jgi:riboflavin biosynthesis pyrimidine reductase